MKTGSHKFLVVSYDDDQQQWFWDFVTAPSTAHAAARVCKDRPYVIAANAVADNELRKMADDLDKITYAKVRANYKRTIQEA